MFTPDQIKQLQKLFDVNNKRIKQIVREEVEIEADKIRHDGTSERLQTISSLRDLEDGFKDVKISIGRLENGQEELRQDVTGLKQGQDGLREDVTGLKVDVTSLKQGQDELKVEQKAQA